jgi:hypothetical protein
MSEEESDPTVRLSPDTYARVSRRVADSDFDSVDGYVEFVLEELLGRLEGTAEEPLGQDEEVRDRLRELGYLD